MERDGVRVLFIEAGENVGRSQRGVTAEIDFSARCEPAQAEAAGFPDNESGLGKIVFKSDVHHHGIGGPAVQHADSGGVSRKYGIGKSVGDILFNHKEPPCRISSIKALT